MLKTGAREGKSTALRRWISRMAAPAIRIFAVPGEDFLRSKGIFLQDFGLDTASNPREANVLVLAGNLSENMIQHAAIAWLQMPRPRLLVSAGSSLPDYLKADIKTGLDAESFHKLKAQLEKLLSSVYSDKPQPFEPGFISEMLDNSDDKHDESDDKNDHSAHEHDHDNNDSNGQDDHHDHGSGFMSMMAMTKDQPRSADGLPMDRNSAWFGPFFPGLSGTPAFKFTLDGDTVAAIKHAKELWPGRFTVEPGISPAELIMLVSGLNPYAEKTWQLLIKQLLKKSAGEQTGLSKTDTASLEKERILNHLNWFTNLGILAGNQWLEKRSSQLMKEAYANSYEKIPGYIQQIRRFKYLKHKLTHTGIIPDEMKHHACKPGSNAWERLTIKLSEIEDSVNWLKAEFSEENNKNNEYYFGTSCIYELDAPSGILKAILKIKDGSFEELEIHTPSALRIKLAQVLVKETELSDALLAIHSLDIHAPAAGNFRITTKKPTDD